ncbi:MAG: general secretion pathway protein GspK [Leptospiraceae bacterium]|nr:general secretion pathway protein GspK [Leptospiraceae bacterium]
MKLLYRQTRKRNRGPESERAVSSAHSIFVNPADGRRGGIVIIAVLLIATSTMTITTDFYNDVINHYSAVRSQAEGYRAHSLAMAGFQAGLTALKMIPEEFLYTKGMVLNPPNIEMDKECDDSGEYCTHLFITYRIQPEDGKLNLNNLVLTGDEPNEPFRKLLIRFFDRFQQTLVEKEMDLNRDAEQRVNALIDWIDLNTNEYGDGAESSYYDALRPPQKIKNSMLYNLSELAVVRGFNRQIVYEPLISEEWKNNRENRASMTDEEKEMLQDEDWIIANNLTAYVPYQASIDDKVNINAARYHVLMSLSTGMTPEAVKALFKLRRDKNGYIKNLSELQDLPEFMASSSQTGLSLYQELVGTGGEISGLIKTQGAYYRVIGVGSVVRPTDNEEDKDVLGIRRVWGIYEKNSQRLIYYAED